ncbi:MAG: small integral membrane transport protein [Deltaproteobacteria bacterium]|nr:MAG: small integral membrane transport protein [Deltaproteobacteria bacterium]
MIRAIDAITRGAAILAAWMFFSIGFMVTYEVVMRKIFNAPTIWVDEVARFFQIWAVYLGCAHILKRGKLITVELFTRSFPPGFVKCCSCIALLSVGFFSIVATYYGAGMVIESVEMGRKTSTMLGVPKWLTESAIPVGFGLLTLQALAELQKQFSPSGSRGAGSDRGASA